MKLFRNNLNWWGTLCALALLFSCTAGAETKPALTEPRLLQQLRSRDAAEALAAARELGRRNSEEGLKALIAAGNNPLTEAYARNSFRPDFFAKKENFDLLYSLLKQPGISSAQGGIVWDMTRSGLPNIENQLFEVLPSLSDKRTASGGNAPRRTAANFLGERRYQPVFPYLKELLNTTDLNELYFTCVAMAQLGSEESSAEVIQCIKVLAQKGSSVASIINELIKLPKSSPVKVVALKKVLPDPMNVDVQLKFFELVGVRQEKSEVPALLAALNKYSDHPNNLGQAAASALLKFDSEAVWKETKEEADRLHKAGRMNDGRHIYIANQASEFLKNPQKVFADRRMGERAQAMEQEQAQIYRGQHLIDKLKATQPQRYVEEQIRQLHALEKIEAKYSDLRWAEGLRSKLSSEYFRLADFVRFRQKNPLEAIKLYEKGGGIDMKDQPHSFLSQILIADIYQYDLRDAAKAITNYQSVQDLLGRLPASSNKDEKVFSIWWKNWLPHEIEYLMMGTAFTGKPSLEEVGGFLTTMVFMSGAPAFDHDTSIVNPFDFGKPVDPKTVEHHLNGQVPSHISLLKSFFAIPSLPSKESILAYLKKHDPGGYWSACFLGMAIYSGSGEAPDKNTAPDQSLMGIFPRIVNSSTGKPSPLLEAAQQFMKQHGIAAHQPDPSKPPSYNSLTPLMTAAERGDIESVKTLLKERANVNTRYNEGPRFHGTPTRNKTALMFAADRGNLEIVKLLLEAGADLYVEDNSEGTAFSYAVKSGNLNIVQYLWENSNKVIFKKKADTNLIVAARHNLSWKKNLPPVDDMVVYLMKNVADDKSSSQAVHGLTLHGISDAIKYLLDRGAKAGIDSLSQASSGGHTDTVRLLLDHGLNANGRHLGVTPLMRAASGQHVETVKLLLSRGADINAADDKGKTVLMYAVGITWSYGQNIISEKYIEFLKFMIKSGADAAAKDKGGKSAIDQLKPEDYYYQQKKSVLQGDGR